jgi:hypothetical protein
VVEEKKSKSQISNNKQITMTKIPNSKPILVIETGDPPAGWESKGQISRFQVSGVRGRKTRILKPEH